MTGRVSITRDVEFDAAHRVARHGGQCANLHGHRYRVALTVSGEVRQDGSSEHGMVVDFGALKAYLAERVHGRWDHGLMVAADDRPLRTILTTNSEAALWKVDVLPCTPTAEHLAQLIASDAIVWPAFRHLSVDRVDVWETPTSMATWQRDA